MIKRTFTYVALKKPFGEQYLPYTLIYEGDVCVHKMHWGNPGTKEQVEYQIAQFLATEERIHREVKEGKK